jgi:arylsulfatase A-like enzyme
MKTDVKTLPEYLQEMSYQTHLVGKWHLGHASRSLLPTSRGFQTFYGFLTGAVSHLTDMTS